MEIESFKMAKNRQFYVRSILQTSILGLLLLGCLKPRTPEGILTKDQMVQIISEIYITEEKLNRVNITPDSAKVVAVFLKDKILESNKVGDSVFQQSFDYYVDHPKDMELIYAAVVDSLQLREERSRKP